MNKKRVILILCVVILIFGAGYTAVSLLQKQSPNEDEPAEFLLSGDIDCIAIEYGGRTTTLGLSEEGWSLKEDAGFPLKASACDALKANLSSLTAVRKIEGGDLREFGLDSPVCTVTGSLGGEQKYRLSFGNQNKAYDVYYLGTDHGIYTVKTGDAEVFFIDAYDLIHIDTAPQIDEDQIVSLEVRSDSGKWYYSLIKDTSGDEAVYRASGTLVNIAEPDKEVALENGKVLDMLKSFSLLYFYDCVSYDADTDDELAVFGLDAPVAQVTAVYETADGERLSYEIDFGAQTDKYIYLSIEGSDMVYTAYTSEVLAFTSPDFPSMIEN